MAKMKWYDWASLALLDIGGLAWGILGVTGFNIVNWLSMGFSWLEQGIYVAVGISAIYSLYNFYKLVK